MKKLFLVLLGIVAVVGVGFVYFNATAVADGGIHQGSSFAKDTDACANCHRAHTGLVADLLKSSTQQALCYTCHGSSGTGAYTNVQDGVYTTTSRSGSYTGLSGSVADAGLKAGGFTNAKMDTAASGTVASAATTSTHSVDASSQTAWGNLASGAGSGAAVTLVCGSCHNPHGNGNYRLLRGQPKGMFDTNTAVNVSDEYLYGTVQSATNAAGGALVPTNAANSIDSSFNNSAANASTNFGNALATWAFTTVADPPAWAGNGTLYTLEVRFYATGTKVGAADAFKLQVNDGSTWTDVTGASFTLDTAGIGSNTTYQYDVSTILNTSVKATAAQIRFIGSGAGADDTINLYVDGARLSYKNYTDSYYSTGTAANFKNVDYAPSNITSWCAQCHRAYSAVTGSGSTASAWTSFQYRHYTNGLSGGCLRCHVAHGTSASMTAAAGSSFPQPDGTTTATSRLLRANNRGVCIQCHGVGGSNDITTN